MTSVSETATFKNQDHSFTELFSVLKKQDVLLKEYPTLAYNTEELKVMYQHVENSIEMLLQGLQDLGKLVGIMAQDTGTGSDGLANVGFFILGVSNLIEALNTLRVDVDYVLRQRGERDY